MCGKKMKLEFFLKKLRMANRFYKILFVFKFYLKFTYIFIYIIEN